MGPFELRCAGTMTMIQAVDNAALALLDWGWRVARPTFKLSVLCMEGLLSQVELIL